MKAFSKILEKKVDRLFLMVWPPWGESKMADVDLSFGFVTTDNPNVLYVVTVDKDELWQPHVFEYEVPHIAFSWEDFSPRMQMWMEAEEDTELRMNVEYYEITKCPLFDKIVGFGIVKIVLVFIEDHSAPFGVRFDFQEDYVISMPNTDGNTVETSRFNQNGSIEYFKKLGAVVYRDLSEF